jgi:predicted nucleotidyltransferase
MRVIALQRDQILSQLRRHFPELQKEFGVMHLSLFGSVARDEAGPDSDVDVLVELGRPTGLIGLMRLRTRLEALLGCRVDVGTSVSLKPKIRDRVLREAVHVA